VKIAQFSEQFSFCGKEAVCVSTKDNPGLIAGEKDEPQDDEHQDPPSERKMV